MNRRNFVSSSLKTGLTACTALCLGGMDKCFADTFSGDPKETSCEAKVDFSQSWIKRFMDVLDSNLNGKTKEIIMKDNGKECYLGSLKSRDLTPEKVNKISPEDFVTMYNNYTGEEGAVLKDGIIEFHYVKNPAGLRVSDGYCLCPIVEKGPADLSGTYCFCSVGYVKEMFTTYLKRPVEVELLESLKRGGKSCKFKVTIS